MEEQRFVVGQPIDTTRRLVVHGVDPGWLEFYPEVRQVVEQHLPTWQDWAFVIEPPREVSRKHLKFIAKNADASETPTVAHPIRDDRNRLIAVVVHQRGYVHYHSLYTYRLAR